MVFLYLILTSVLLKTAACNPDAKRLYDDLLSNYNRLIRPVSNSTDTVLVKLGLRLSQLIELNLKDQILTTNVWLEHEWMDYKFEWDPSEYGGVTELCVPSEHIWLPDIVLYNNADGEYVVTTMTKAVLHSNGKVLWTPPAIFKSSCEIDVQYFPYDQQTCFMKFGSWSYGGAMIDLQHINQKPGKSLVEEGIDLREYYQSVEWDIINVPAEAHKKYYPCCPEPYPDIFFNITIRRRTLFYTVNLIVPCVGISSLSVLVFYLPADSREKIVLSITILLSQTMYFLLISEIMPSTSLAVPLLGRYLLFTMFLISACVLITIIILNIHYRKPSTHKMKNITRKIFIKALPKLLLMRVPQQVMFNAIQYQKTAYAKDVRMDSICSSSPSVSSVRRQFDDQLKRNSDSGYTSFLQGARGYFDDIASLLIPGARYPFQLEKAVHNVRFIQHHLHQQDAFTAEDLDWAFVAMVLDRLFLWVFAILSFTGTAMILYDGPKIQEESVSLFAPFNYTYYDD